jgi:uncharacterized protein YfiM (DUF2279 family)
MVPAASSLALESKGAKDRWFGEDKAMHLFACLYLSSGAALALEAGHTKEDVALISAFSGAVLVGIGKEIWDMVHPGQPSWKDLTADVIGAGLGVLLVRAF